MKRILVLCTANSCRSIMAEALINHLKAEEYHAMSAGSQPAGYVHPKSVETLRKHGIDPGSPVSKSWDVFAGQSFDYVITVCEQAANEICPIFYGEYRKLHWSTPEPAKVHATAAALDGAFDQAFQLLKTRIEKEWV